MFTKEGDMPYRQAWETGHQHAAHLRSQAAIERARRAQDAQRPSALRSATARAARAFAERLERFAEGLDARPARTFTSRPGGA